jgi:hypothetical protein
MLLQAPLDLNHTSRTFSECALFLALLACTYFGRSPHYGDLHYADFLCALMEVALTSL